ncbi:tigger transposable element-derived protein 1-like [Macrobrachium rosenbergii]|uniref:tigger transposable element-derived protein 1-like n=1 Tax=Macrobrachium rosenbergii TaxID=79674 RepID=UPI0034D5C97B
MLEKSYCLLQQQPAQCCKQNQLDQVQGEASSGNEKAASDFSSSLAEVIREGYCAEQVFNVDETGLLWKCMPTHTYIAKEVMALGHKVSKERLTLLLGANAAGDFKLKPTLVYLAENPRALKGNWKGQLSLIWKSNKKPMDQGVTASLKAYSLRRSFATALRATEKDKNLTLKDFWKTYNILAVSKQFDLEVEAEGITELLISHVEELSAEDLIQLEKQLIEENEETPTLGPKRFTSHELADGFALTEEIMAKFEAQDPNTASVHLMDELVRIAFMCSYAMGPLWSWRDVNINPK